MKDSQGCQQDELANGIAGAPPAADSASPPHSDAATRAATRIAAAATLSPASRLKYFVFLLLAIFVQLNWGLFGVSTRFLQVHARRPVPSLQLCVVMTAVSWAGLLVFYTIPAAVGALVAHLRQHIAARRCGGAAAANNNSSDQPAEAEAVTVASSTAAKQPQQQSFAAAPMDLASFDAAGAVSDCASFIVVMPRCSFSAANGSASFVRATLRAAPAVKARGRLPPGDAADIEAAALSIAEEGGPGAANRGQTSPTDSQPAASAGQAATRRADMLKALLAATFVGTLVALQGLTLLYASRFIFAYVLQLVFLLTPLVTAVANHFVLQQKTPRALVPALLAALIGSALVITGNYTTYGASHGGPISARDMGAGMALAVVSMLLLAAYLVALQVTQHVVTGVQVMYANVVVGLVLLTPIALIAEGTDWSWVAALSPFDWGVMFFAAFWIDAVNTILTQTAIRVVGSAVMSLFICCRLASSVAGSVVLLHEVPRSPLTFAGFGVVALALTGFMGLQLVDKSREEQRATAAAAAATNADALVKKEEEEQGPSARAAEASSSSLRGAQQPGVVASAALTAPSAAVQCGDGDVNASAADAAERGEAHY